MTSLHQPDTLLAPHVAGDLPGPRSAEFLARQQDYESNARSYPRRLPIAIEQAAGSLVRDVDGNVFIDFLAGAGVLSLGHNHPELVAAVTEALGGPVAATTLARYVAVLGVCSQPGHRGRQANSRTCGAPTSAPALLRSAQAPAAGTIAPGPRSSARSRRPARRTILRGIPGPGL